MSSKVTREFLRNVQQFTKAVTAWALKLHAKQLEVDNHVSRCAAFDATSYVNSLRAQLVLAVQDEDDLYTVHLAKCREVAAELKQLGIGE